LTTLELQATAAPAAPRATDRFYPLRRALEAIVFPLGALLLALVLFSIFLLTLGKSPATFFDLVWRGAFASTFSLQNTLQRASPLLLTSLCVAIPAQLGLVIIGGEGAVLLGGLAATVVTYPMQDAPALLTQLAMVLAGCAAGGAWIGITGWLRAKRGLNETIVSLVMYYIGLAVFNHLVEGPLRDPASLNKPSTYAIPDAAQIGSIPGTELHPGLPVGVLACIGAWVLINRTATGFAARMTGGNLRAAQLQGLPVARLMIGACLLGGACAGLAGTIEVAAVLDRANTSLAAGYGFTGILISFLARHNPLAIMPMAVLLGGVGAAGGLLQRRLGVPDATVQVLQGLIFVSILTSETMYGRIRWFQPARTEART
jgi:simple sugar transport system permease protein